MNCSLPEANRIEERSIRMTLSLAFLAPDFLVELRGFEPMAIAGAVRSRVGSLLGDSLARSRRPSAEDFPFAWPPLDIGEEERTFAVIAA
jgi:hypothetical protein